MNNCIYVAEVGINHNGEMAMAKALIDLAVKHKFDYVKFQKRHIDSCYTKEYLDQPRESPWGKTQRDQKNGLEFSLDDYDEIDIYCKEKGIGWYYSPWDLISAKEMSAFETDFIKIAKACITNKDLVKFYNNRDDSLVVSINAFDPSSKEAIGHFLNIDYILSCISIYPAPANCTGVDEILALKRKYWSKYIGYSNHSPNWIHPVIASYLGAQMIEVHITLDKTIYGSDQKASLDNNDLTNMMKYRLNPPSFEEANEIMAKEKEVIQKLRQTW